MQKRIGQNPRAKGRELLASRCQSAMMFDKPNKELNENELLSFSLKVNKVIQQVLPEIQLPVTYESLNSIAEVLKYAFQEVIQTTEDNLTASFNEKELSMQKMSTSLMRYEELLNEKRAELDIEIEHWTEEREAIKRKIEADMGEFLSKKAKLENELEIEKQKLKEQAQDNSEELRNIEEGRNLILAERMEIKNLQWELEQKARVIEEKEEIISLREKMVNSDLNNLTQEKSKIENERMINKVLTDELVQSAKGSSTNLKEKSPYTRMNNSNSVEYFNTSSYDQLGSRSTLANDSEQVITLSKKSYLSLVNMKKSLKVSAEELRTLKNSILPELNDKSKQLTDLVQQLNDLKSFCEQILKEFTEKLKVFDLSFEALVALNIDCEERVRGLEKSQNEVEGVRAQLAQELLKIQQKKKDLVSENEEFQNEKISFFEEMAEERQRIENYYTQIQEKVSMLNKKHEDLLDAQKLQNEREMLFKIHSDA